MHDVVLAPHQLDLERFAELSAEIDVSGDRSGTLARAGLTVSAWLAVQEHWLGRFGDEASHRRFGLAQRHGQLYLAARLRFQKARPAAAERPIDVRAEHVSLDARASVPPRVVETPLAAGLGTGASATGGPRLALAQYAGLAAELAVAPDRQPEILARYGFDDDALGREHAAWQLVFAGEPPRFEEYLARFRHYRDWLLGAAAPAGASSSVRT
ncbi:MAG: hypothetical protein JNL79_35345 [Myxococcales bacterium]|nr:hypothetical protein [Myxococcales bacterium]